MLNSAVHTFYISTGAKNAMYTLRIEKSYRDDMGLTVCVHDIYICNLAVDEMLAVSKAQDYFDRVCDRYTNASMMTVADGILKRRGKLSAMKTRWIESIESGIFPFGKFRGQSFTDATDSYILFFADKIHSTDFITAALATACMGVALDRDLIAKRDRQRQDRIDRDLKSNWRGVVGERIQISGEMIGSYYKEQVDGSGFWINRVRMNDDIFAYIGSKSLAPRGSVVEFTATVKSHNEYKNIKSTTIKRPLKLKVIEPQTVQ